MKLIYGYIILFISFFGLIYLQYTMENRSGVAYRVINKREVSNNNIIHNRIQKLELVVDSMANVYAAKPMTTHSPEEKIPIFEPTPQITPVKIKKDMLIKNPFQTLNDAAKIRDSRTKLSLIAQDYINLAYEMGGSSWYGAEDIWDTEAFKLRARLLHKDDG